jgi:hypothetical protein
MISFLLLRDEVYFCVTGTIKRNSSSHRYNMKKVLGSFLFFPVLFASAQSPVSRSDNGSTAPDSAANLYFAVLGNASAIYNGRVFYGYPGIKGDAFYPSGGWQKGSVLYDGSWHHDISLMYNIHKDEVVIRHPNSMSVCPFNERVDKFYFGEYAFVRLAPDKDNVIKGGFYQQLSKGKVTIMVARQKKIEENIVDLAVERKFVSSNTYYALKDGHYYLVDKKSSLLNLLKDKRQSIMKQLKKEKLKYKHDPEKTIISMAEFYNQS